MFVRGFQRVCMSCSLLAQTAELIKLSIGDRWLVQPTDGRTEDQLLLCFK